MVWNKERQSRSVTTLISYQREINDIDGDWFEVTNYWDVVKEPVKVRIKIGTDDNGNLIVIDFR